jgi:O-antigen ligase
VIGIFVLFCLLSSFLALLRTNIVFSQIFALRLLEKWNIFLPWNQLGTFASLRSLLNVLEGILFLTITLDVINHPGRVGKVLRVLLVSAVCVSLLGILQYLFEFRPLAPAWMTDRQIIQFRVNSTFSDANSLGTFLAGSMIIGVCELLSVHAGSRWKILLGTGLIFLCFVLTGSRAAWVALCFALILLPFVMKKVRSNATTTRSVSFGTIPLWINLLVVGLLIAMVLVVTVPGSRLQSFALHPVRRINSILGGRVSLWIVSWRIFCENPVFGRGIGTFPQSLDRFQDRIRPILRHENAHNYYMQVLAETGILGFLLFFFIVTRFLWEGV